MSEKFCIFCGGKPENKNMEHVIPQWLIRKHGLEKTPVKVFSLGSDKKIPFMQFKFPACTECNSEFAKIEIMVKQIFNNILSGNSVTGYDAAILMMWFDKIRIGLWLSNIYYNPDLKNVVHPHVFINQAVLSFDKMLSIQKIQTKETDERVSWNGTNNVVFNCSPDAFTMIIGDYYFINAAQQNMVSPRVGFPKILKDNNGLLSNVFVPGNHKVINPVIEHFVPRRESITFYQPVYHDYLYASSYLSDNYMIEHSYDAKCGIGGVFVQQGNTDNIKYLQKNDKVDMDLCSVSAPDFDSDILRLQSIVSHNGRLPCFDNLDFLLKISEYQLNIYKKCKNFKNAKYKG